MKLFLLPLLLFVSMACDRREAQMAEEDSTTADTQVVPAPTTEPDVPPTAPPALAECEGLTGQAQVECREREEARRVIEPAEAGDPKDQTTPPS